MATMEQNIVAAAEYPVRVDVVAQTEGRNRLTTAFRFFLALPHVLLVGGPVAATSAIVWSSDNGVNLGWSYGTGIIGALAALVAVISWFAILFTGRHPERLWRLAAFYLRWRVRAVAYLTLLRDEYPPFGDAAYPSELVLPRPAEPRNRLTVAFRMLLALPHVCLLGLLSLIWGVATAIAWAVILLTGRYPEALYGFAIGVLAWDTRVEAYLLLLTDEYPPFTLRA